MKKLEKTKEMFELFFEALEGYIIENKVWKSRLDGILKLLPSNGALATDAGYRENAYSTEKLVESASAAYTVAIRRVAGELFSRCEIFEENDFIFLRKPRKKAWLTNKDPLSFCAKKALKV